MASSQTVTLDTTAPQTVAVSIDSGASYSGDLDVVVGLTSPDADTSQVKIYGDVDDAFATGEYRALEANAPWVAFAATKNVRLSAGDGSKTVRVKFRDDVGNATSEATDTIVVDTDLPVMTLGTFDRSKVSEVGSFDTISTTLSPDEAVDAWELRLVPNAGSTRDAGTLLASAAGSTASGGAIAGGASEAITIKGADIRDTGGADAQADGLKVIKAFGRDPNTQNWSV